MRDETPAEAVDEVPMTPPMSNNRAPAAREGTAQAAPADYVVWLTSMKARIHAAQQRAALAVNRELLALYWQLGRDILDRQAAGLWGDRIVDRVASDLRSAFPAMKGFSRSNLKYMRSFAEAWRPDAIGQQAVGQLPWGHNLVLLTRLKDPDARLAYAEAALQHGWSRAMLVHHIDVRTMERQGKAITNFAERLPADGSRGSSTTVCSSAWVTASTARPTRRPPTLSGSRSRSALRRPRSASRQPCLFMT
jgi:predicted nuclease of restriction endonuclease-like (RecB) superfamily